MNENLTPQIVTALLQDGTVKMTGEEIAAAIADAIGALDKPYRFRGVATPDLAPGSIFEPTLYVAVANATYGPFSNQSVDKGKIVFFTSDDGGYWEAVTAYDPNPGGGGESGLKVIVSTADWALISGDGVTANTKAEAAEIAGITEAELDLMLDSGAYAGAVLFAYKAGEEAGTAIVKRSYDPDDGQSHAYCNMVGWHNLSLEFEPNYGYSIFGAGREG